jgi:hypothetical protein
MSSYTPVPYDFREMIQEEIEKGKSGKIFYFNGERKLDDLDGKIVSLDEINGEGLFIRSESGKSVRIDRIITLFGKPGAAYDEYAALGNSCMECHGGYDFSE